MKSYVTVIRRAVMFDTTTLIAYLAASIAIILAPGPAQALMLARSVSDGKKAGILTAVGLNIGTIVHALAAAVGLSTILVTSAVAFATVKYLGAAYLVYLGVKALLSKEHKTNSINTTRAGSRRAFTKAVITGILNPKVALFFLAFLPQFVDAERGFAFLQFFILGVILAMLDIFYESTLALAAVTLSGWFRKNPRFASWRQKVTGAVLVGLGVRLALSEH
jgi:threonine/homoserine/homoserine lactone efflux protein